MSFTILVFQKRLITDFSKGQFSLHLPNRHIERVIPIKPFASHTSIRAESFVFSYSINLSCHLRLLENCAHTFNGCIMKKALATLLVWHGTTIQYQTILIGSNSNLLSICHKHTYIINTHFKF